MSSVTLTDLIIIAFMLLSPSLVLELLRFLINCLIELTLDDTLGNSRIDLESFFVDSGSKQGEEDLRAMMLPVGL